MESTIRELPESYAVRRRDDGFRLVLRRDTPFPKTEDARFGLQPLVLHL